MLGICKIQIIYFCAPAKLVMCLLKAWQGADSSCFLINTMGTGLQAVEGNSPIMPVKQAVTGKAVEQLT